MILRSTTVPSPSTKGEGEAAGGGEGVMAADLLMDELGELEWQVKAKLDEAVKVSMDGCVCVCRERKRGGGVGPGVERGWQGGLCCKRQQQDGLLGYVTVLI